MARHWEKFTEGPTVSSRDRVHVTLNGKGLFQFNRKAYEHLGSPKAAVLYFEKSTSMIGISSAHPQLREAFPFKASSSCFTLRARPFCRHFGIEIDGTEAFADPELDPQGILQLDLKTTRRVYGGRGKRRKVRGHKNPTIGHRFEMAPGRQLEVCGR